MRILFLLVCVTWAMAGVAPGGGSQAVEFGSVSVRHYSVGPDGRPGATVIVDVIGPGISAMSTGKCEGKTASRFRARNLATIELCKSYSVEWSAEDGDNHDPFIWLLNHLAAKGWRPIQFRLGDDERYVILQRGGRP